MPLATKQVTESQKRKSCGPLMRKASLSFYRLSSGLYTPAEREKKKGGGQVKYQNMYRTRGVEWRPSSQAPHSLRGSATAPSLHTQLAAKTASSSPGSRQTPRLPGRAAAADDPRPGTMSPWFVYKVFTFSCQVIFDPASSETSDSGIRTGKLKSDRDSGLKEFVFF